MELVLEGTGFGTLRHPHLIFIDPMPPLTPAIAFFPCKLLFISITSSNSRNKAIWNLFGQFLSLLKQNGLILAYCARRNLVILVDFQSIFAWKCTNSADSCGTPMVFRCGTPESHRVPGTPYWECLVSGGRRNFCSGGTSRKMPFFGLKMA